MSAVQAPPVGQRSPVDIVKLAQLRGFTIYSIPSPEPRRWMWHSKLPEELKNMLGGFAGSAEEGHESAAAAAQDAVFALYMALGLVVDAGVQ